MLAIVQARVESSRRPGKVLAAIGSMPMVEVVLRRTASANTVTSVVLATSDHRSDDPVALVADELGIERFRGPHDDVLARFVGASRGHVGPILRITADCPLIDPQIIDHLAAEFLACGACQYGSNITPRTFPDGLDCEIFTASALHVADREASTAHDREHVTPFLLRDPDRFPRVTLTSPTDRSHLRWTVDTEADIAFMRELAGRLGTRILSAGMLEILDAIHLPPSLASFEGIRA